MKFRIGIFCCLWLLSWSCSTRQPVNNSQPAQNAPSEKGDKKTKHDKDTASDQPGANGVNSAACDRSLWSRVYEPERLEVQDECKVVTGTIAERDSDEDGDEHMLLKLDDGQDDLLTKKNLKKKDGNLVIEAVCVNPSTLKKVGSTCKGFTNSVQLPNVGDHVRVTGSLVNDTHNGWTEIHPITRIEKLGQ
ncbi:MAG: hypothetical protein JO314_07510 [Acidobacteria bacterium]|nr:hypothetical protein [Acidobacteriota bacterium]